MMTKEERSRLTDIQIRLALNGVQLELNSSPNVNPVVADIVVEALERLEERKKKIRELENDKRELKQALSKMQRRAERLERKLHRLRVEFIDRNSHLDTRVDVNNGASTTYLSIDS